MNGCLHSQKSFTVYNNEQKSTGICEKCKQEIYGVVYRINRVPYCRGCFSNTPVNIKPLNLEGIKFLAGRDLYDYVDTINFGKPVRIRSKRQFLQECNKKGIIPVAKGETQRWAEYQKRCEPMRKEKKIEEYKNQIRERFKSTGVYSSEKLFKKVR